MSKWVPTFESWFNNVKQIDELVRWGVEYSGAWLPFSISHFEESDDRYKMVYKHLNSLFSQFYGFEVPELIENNRDLIAERVVVAIEQKFGFHSQLAGPAEEYDDEAIPGPTYEYSQCCVFGKTLYRVPTNSELKEFEKYPNISEKDILNEFVYTIVGRGVLGHDNLNTIKEAISKLVNQYPDDKRYSNALTLANKLKTHR